MSLQSSVAEFELLFLLEPDNLVDGLAFRHLTHADLTAMFPRKIGVARKLSIIIDQLTSCEVAMAGSSQAAHDQSVNSNIGKATASTSVTVSASHSSSEQPAAVDLPMDGGSVYPTTSSMPFPLPTYSTRIKEVLSSGNILLDLDQFIEETAYHVLANGDMTSKSDYERFGRQLAMTYPCVEFHGKKTSWVCCLLTFELIRNLSHCN